MIIFTTVSVVPPSINLTEIKTRSIQIDPDPHLSHTNLDTLPTHALLSRLPVLISLRLNSGSHPSHQGSGFTAQDSDGHLDPKFNFIEIKSRLLMEILILVHHYCLDKKIDHINIL